MKKNYLFLFLFIIFVTLGRVLFPFGDEPDYEIRTDRLSKETSAFFKSEIVQNLILGMIDKGISQSYHDFYSSRNSDVPHFYTVVHGCNVNEVNSSIGLWHNINLKCIEMNFDYMFSRIALTFVFASPLLFIIFFRKFVYRITMSYKVESPSEWDRKIDSILLSLIFPGMIYFLGLISLEAFFISLSLFVFLFWRRYLILFFIFYFLYKVDDGNFVVVSIFAVMLTLFEYVYKRLGMSLLLLFSSLLILTAYFFGVGLLEVLAGYFPDSKFSSIYQNIALGDISNKYPLFLRPVVVFMSFVFATPSGIKSIVIYLVFICLLIVYFVKIYKGSYIRADDKGIRVIEKELPRFNHLVGVVSALTFIFCLSYTIPSHSYAKYLMFLLPFLTYSLLYYFRFIQILKVFSFMTLFLFINLTLYTF